MSNSESVMLPYEVYKAGKACSNNQYLWHKVDGYCACCRPADFSETDKQITERRNAKGYR